MRRSPQLRTGASAAWPVSARNTSSRSAVSTVRPATPSSSRPSSTRRSPAMLPSLGTCRVSASVVGGGVRVCGRCRGQPCGVGELHRHVPARHPALQLRGRALGDQPAAVEDPDPVGEVVGLVEVLRGQQHRHAVGDQLADDRPQVATAARVETGRRLVEEDQPGPDDERHRQVQPTLHAAGVGLRPPVGRVDEVEALQHHGHGGRPRSPGPGAPGRPSGAGSRGR